MITLKSLLNESNLEKFWWMNPNGKLIKVKREGHAEFAAHYLSTLVKSNPNINMKDVYQSMYNLNWIRVTVFGYHGKNELHFNIKSGNHPSRIQNNILNDTAIENNVDIIFDNTNGIRYDVSGLWEHK